MLASADGPRPSNHSAVWRARSSPFSASPCIQLCWLVALLYVLQVRPLHADWPQALGVGRDGKSDAELALDSKWPASLQPRWSVDIGSGYAGAAIRAGVVYVTDRRENQEALEALELTTGRSLWRTSWPATYQSRMNPDAGPRCVPTVTQDRAICYGAAGDLVCIQISDGKKLWSRNLRKEYRADDGYFGAGSAPLVVGDVVVVNVGGSQAGIVGVSIDNGKTAWTATKYDASYAAPVQLAQNGPSGKPVALVVTRLKTVLLDCGDGKVLSEVDFGQRGPTVNAAIPIAVGVDQYLLTASYGIGATLVDTRGSKLSPVYGNDPILSSQYNSPVRLGDRLFGIDGREDFGEVNLVAIDAARRSLSWSQRLPSVAHLIGTKDHVLVIGLEGNLWVVDGQARNYRAVQQSELPSGTYRALPALSRKTLVVRSSAADGQSSKLIAVELP